MENLLNSIIKDFRNSNIEEMKEVANTLQNWKQEILYSFVWINNRRISNGPIEEKNHYIKKIIYNGNGIMNFKRTRNRILYSQNMYESFDISYEYNDLIKMKESDYASTDDEEFEEFEEIN